MFPRLIRQFGLKLANAFGVLFYLQRQTARCTWSNSGVVFLALMQTGQRIFVSVENNAYCGWQCKLFYASAITRLNHRPTFIVHETGHELHRDFQQLIDVGATVRVVPSYARSVSDFYRVRNQAGSLIHAAEMCDENEWIVLCDPDMIFRSDPELPNSLAVNFYFYLDYDRPEVFTAMSKLNITREQLETQKDMLRGGVPYVIPAAIAPELGRAWFDAVDAFPPRGWVDMMYAFGLAAIMLDLKVTQTDVVDMNWHQWEPVQRQIIHYCQGDDTWDKRYFKQDSDIEKLWSLSIPAEEGSILREILDQIGEAKRFYDNGLQ